MMDATTIHDIWEEARRGAALLVDLRSPERFGLGHPAGAINVVYSDRGLADRIALVAAGRQPVAVVTADPVEVNGTRLQLASAGRAFLGAIPDDPAAWHAAGVPSETLPDLSLTALVANGASTDRVVVDVREPMEWETGYVPGAVLIPLGRLSQELDQLPRDREIAVICEAGVRSATAASILQAAGFPRVVNVREGSAGYRRTGWPLAYLENQEEELEDS
jgi:hydroxyacylglutathione hydrolase